MINPMVMKMNNRVIVIGAGAAGTMAAGTASDNGADVLLIERNDKIGRKVMYLMFRSSSLIFLEMEDFYTALFLHLIHRM